MSDDLLDTIGVSGSPVSAGRQLRKRNDFADPIALVIYNETDDDMLVDLVREIRGSPDGRPDPVAGDPIESS